MQFIGDDPGFQRAWTKSRHLMTIDDWIIEAAHMRPVAAAARWSLPPIESAGALAAWLALMPAELDWFADLKGLAARGHGAGLEHYRYRLISKPSGGMRLIEAPKQRLKAIQRQILSQILDRIPPHPAVHGFVHGRSIRGFAAPHTAQRVVLRMDLENFFPSISGPRVQAMFRTVGYPEPVADLLGGICTNVPPRAIQKQLAWEYSRPHLSQGAPTSPALANICAWRLDRRLASLAEASGAVYTRYADDLAFSGGDDFDRCVDRFSARAAAIAVAEGFSVNYHKTRIMRQGVRQQLAGIVTNQHMNVRREEFDRLKAILTNCVRHGPRQQNRDGHPDFRAHLAGRVAFVESINPSKARRLRVLFDRISWD